MLLTLALATTAARAQTPTNNVRDLILFASDKGVVKKAKTTYRWNIPYSELEGKFADPRFVLRHWGDKGAILIDRKIGPIAEREDSIKLGKALLASIGADLTVQLGKAPDESREALEQFFDAHNPPSLRAEGFKAADAAVGLAGTLQVTISGQGRSPVTIQMPLRPAGVGERERSLMQNPAQLRKPTADEKQAIGASLTDTYEQLSEADLHLYGLAKSLLPDGMRELAKALEEIEREDAKMAADVGAKLLAKLGISGSTLPDHAGTFADLPDSLKKGLLDQAGRDWRGLGFSNQAEAESFLANGGDIRITSWLGLIQCTGVGDPRSHRPPTFTIQNFVSVSGGIAP